MAERNEKELQDLAKYKPGFILDRKWKITDLIDEGGFGKVYRVNNLIDSSIFAALKIESSNMEGGSAIKLERSALERVHRDGKRNHVPELFCCGRKGNVCYMIVTLLGDNLKKIKLNHFPNGYPIKTWVKMAIQCLYAIKVVHDAGFVHRDIKAANFVLGHSTDPKKARMIHILDFGLARQYVLPDPKRPNAYVPRAARSNCEFRGTWTYASPSMHDAFELGRKDDIWSFLYMMIDMYAVLPWSGLDDLDSIGWMKQNMKDEDLLIKMPNDLITIPTHLRTLGIYSRPNYNEIFDALNNIFKRCKASWYEPYEWESKEVAEANTAAMKSNPPGYVDSGVFFNEDPIKVNDSPAAHEAALAAVLEAAATPEAVAPPKSSKRAKKKSGAEVKVNESMKGKKVERNSNSRKKSPAKKDLDENKSSNRKRR